MDASVRARKKSLVDVFFEPVDNTPLVLFRIAFGCLLALETAGAIATGWVRENLIAPRVHFPMIGFEWVQPLPGSWMLAYFVVMALCGVAVALGAFYRCALGAFTVLWSLVYVMQTVSYNNHYYLLVLLCLLLLPAPAHAWASVDARRAPALRDVVCPRWCIAAPAAQIGLVYAFAALAKLDADWLSGRPVAVWLAARADGPLGPLLAQPWCKWVLVYGGLAFDASIVPLLLWRRTRLVALALAALFHLFNSAVFRIGIFPYLALALCLFFFPGESLRRRFLPRKPPAPPAAAPFGRRRWLVAGLALYFALQLALPLRHHLYPGDVNWTEEGHRMSWRMMTRTKSGSIRFELRHPPSGERWTVRPTEFLTEKQSDRVAVRPDLIWQFAQFLEGHYATEGRVPIEVRARSSVSLNGRPPRPLVDPGVDLAAENWHPLRSASWILDP